MLMKYSLAIVFASVSFVSSASSSDGELTDDGFVLLQPNVLNSPDVQVSRYMKPRYIRPQLDCIPEDKPATQDHQSSSGIPLGLVEDYFAKPSQVETEPNTAESDWRSRLVKSLQKHKSRVARKVEITVRISFLVGCNAPRALILWKKAEGLGCAIGKANAAYAASAMSPYLPPEIINSLKPCLTQLDSAKAVLITIDVPVKVAIAATAGLSALSSDDALEDIERVCFTSNQVFRDACSFKVEPGLEGIKSAVRNLGSGVWKFELLPPQEALQAALRSFPAERPMKKFPADEDAEIPDDWVALNREVEGGDFENRRRLRFILDRFLIWWRGDV